MKQRKFNRNTNQGNGNSSVKENDTLSSRMERLEKLDDKQVAYHKNQFYSLLMLVSMFKTQLEIDYEEYLNGSRGFSEDFRPTELLTDFLEMAGNKFEAYCGLTSLKTEATFIVKALLARHYRDDEYVNTVVATHFDMLEVEIIRLKMEIAELKGEKIAMPFPHHEYLMKTMNEINQECPGFYEEVEGLAMEVERVATELLNSQGGSDESKAH